MKDLYADAGHGTGDRPFITLGRSPPPSARVFAVAEGHAVAPGWGHAATRVYKRAIKIARVTHEILLLLPLDQEGLPMARSRGFKGRGARRGRTPAGRLSLARYAGTIPSLWARYRGTGSRTRTSTSRTSTNPPPITGEHDSRTVYRKRRMPGRRRRRWVSFVRRTQAVISKALSPSFLIRTRAATVTTSANKQNWYQGHCVLGYASADSEFTDVAALRDRVGIIATNGTGTGILPDRFIVTGYMVETQVSNTGTTTAYIDMYYWRTKRNVPSTIKGFTFSSPIAVWQAALQDMQPNVPVLGSTLDPSDYGNTPFQSTNFAKYVSIWKKVRVKLGPGGVTQVEQRSGRNRFINAEFMEPYSLLGGTTEGILMITYGTPSATNQYADPVTLCFSTNVNYTYRVLMAATTTGGTTQA